MPTARFRDLADQQPPLAEVNAAISVPARVNDWLARGPAIFDGEDRAQLDELCRQIDVRKRISAAYAAGWKRLEPETTAAPAVVSGVIAVLLANAGGVGGAGADGSLNDGWGLKCTNSALKALDAWPGVPDASELRSWAMEILDRVRAPGEGAA